MCYIRGAVCDSQKGQQKGDFSMVPVASRTDPNTEHGRGCSDNDAMKCSFIFCDILPQLQNEDKSRCTEFAEKHFPSWNWCL